MECDDKLEGDIDNNIVVIGSCDLDTDSIDGNVILGDDDTVNLKSGTL